MSAYLGPAGGLVPFRCPSAVGIATDRAMSYKTTMGGRVKVQRGPTSRRQWQVELGSATPSELANLQALAEAGTPPWVWVDPYAQVTNLFTPEQSTLAPGTWSGGGVEGGAVTVDGSYSPRSASKAEAGFVGFGRRDGEHDHPSVIPGLPISTSVYVRGSGSLHVVWLDWSGGLVSSSVVASYDHPVMDRVSAEGVVPPAGAVSVQVYVSGAYHAALPCVSWTPDAPAWSMGRGCTRAVVEGLSESVQSAVRDLPYRRRSALTFTVREVG